MQDINSLYKIFIKFFLLVTLLLTSYLSAWAQANKKRMLTPKDYALWSYLTADQISSNGNWVSYRLYYDYTGKDTLGLQQTHGNKNYVFPGSTTGKFNGETDFACLKGDTLILLDLKSGKQLKIPRTDNFAFSANQKFMVVLLKQADQMFTLEVRDRSGTVIQTVLDIAQYSFNSFGNGILYSTLKDNIYITEFILLKDSISKKTVSTNHKNLIKNFVWKENSIAFMELLKDGPKIFVYNILLDKLSSLDPNKVTGFPSQMKVSDAGFRNILLSDDGERVFFWLKENQLKSGTVSPMGVQIWNTKDKQLFESKKHFGDYRMSDKMAIWDLKESSVFQITDKDLPSGFLSADYKYAFTYDKNAYEPQSQQYGAYDLNLVNLKNGEKKRIVERYVFGDNIPSRSPDGRYLCYAKRGHWWIYNIEKDLHTNITFGMPNSFFVEDRNSPGEDEPYGIGGWTKDGEVILYDRYDLWKISLDGKAKVRLTKGREIEKAYRINFFSNPFDGDVDANKPNIDLGEGFLLTVINKETRETGLSYWSSKLGIKVLVWESKKIEQVSKAENKDIYVYVDQNFQTAPRLMVYDGSAKVIVKTNTQQEHFYWGKNKRIEYTVDGKKTKGILFYPAAYNPEKKYPMVVNIYERQFGYLNYYENPTLLSEVGFNVTNFTLQDYFVLYPDINYEYGNLKKSVTNSVLAAVDTALRKGNIDPAKVGLTGSSFGGYETDLVITQTDRFATAVAGLAWTDLVSAYLYVGSMFKRPDFFRAENHQLRIGKSLFEDLPAYLKNSPVLLADKVKTPLLGWVGENDRHVNSSHSMEFYLALRRANKEHTLLVYPGEEHGLEKKENATDLSIRIMQWFDYYLKDGKKQDWMNNN